MISLESASRRSVLQRRSSISNTVQAALDGAAIIGLTYFLIDWHIGYITSEYVNLLLLLVGTVALVYDHFAIYRTNANFTRKALMIFKGWTLSFAVLLGLAFLSKQTEEYSRILVAQLFILGYASQILLLFFVRWIQTRFLTQADEQESAIIVGSGRLANYLHKKISSNPWLGIKVEGCVLLDDSQAFPTAQKPGQPRVLGPVADLIGLLDVYNIRTVYFVTPLDGSGVLEKLYFKLLDKHVAVHWVPDIFSLRLINHSVREIAGIPIMTLSETPLMGTRLLMKSIEDKVLAALIFIMILPLLAVIALAVKLDSPGPIFFRQNRMGWNGKTFKIWKFRSMYVHQPEGNVVKQAEKNDSRITRVGNILRRTSLDELPQILNVLKGEMSLVGPRPHAVQHDLEYSQRIADYFARHRIKPGITGLAQVRGFRGETREIEQMMQRVESDIEYINNWSLWLDVSILARTVTAFSGKNAY